ALFALRLDFDGPVQNRVAQDCIVIQVVGAPAGRLEIGREILGQRRRRTYGDRDQRETGDAGGTATCHFPSFSALARAMAISWRAVSFSSRANAPRRIGR